MKRKPRAPSRDEGDQKRKSIQAKTPVEIIPREISKAERKQWDCVRAWRRWLEGGGLDELPTAISSKLYRDGIGEIHRKRWLQLQAIWEACTRAVPYPRAFDREADEGLGVPPLHAFFFWLDMGFYPPPELLLGLADVFQGYLEDGGAKNLGVRADLEVHFFGPRINRSGSYASRYSIDRRILSRTLNTYMVMHLTGKKRTAAAREVLAEEVLYKQVEDGKQITAADLVKRIKARVRPVANKPGK